jgi:hypothetical protein
MSTKPSGTNVNVQATDRVIVFRSTGDQELKVGEGTPVTATGSPKDKTATVHGTTTPGGVLIHNPA